MSRYDYAAGVANAGEGKIDLGPAATHDIGDRPAAAAGVRPAERAVAGVEIQIRIARRADVRHVRRGRGAQPRPELRARRVAGRGEELERAPENRPAAHFVQLDVIAVQLRRAGDA